MGRRRGNPIQLYRTVTDGRESPYWTCRFRLPSGKLFRKSTRCTERAAAERIAAEWYRRAQHEAADAVAGIERPSDVTMLALADDYISDARLRRARRYVESLEDHIRAYVLPYFGADSRAADVTRRDVEAFQRAVLAGAIQTKAMHVRRRPTPTAATCNRIMVTLRQMFEFGVRLGWLQHNPARGVRKVDERTVSQFRALTDAEIGALVEELRRARRRKVSGEDHARWVRFMIATGLRNDESQRVRWSHVDFQRRRLTVPADIAKGRKTRHVPLTRAALAVLDEIRGDAEPMGLIFGPRRREGVLRRAWKRTGLPGRAPTAHDFRHTCASRAAASGLDLAQMMEWFAWTDPSTAQRYIHLYGPRWADMASKMEAIEAARGGEDC